jgi:hypothetical protein
MDWAHPIRGFFRDFAAIFLFARARSLLRDSGNLGYVFLRFAPLNVFAGRSFMPDVPSLSLAISGLHFFLRWIRDGRGAQFYLAAIAISLSF